MSDKLKPSLKAKFYLVPDKFTDGEYWAIGKYHDSCGENFAKTIYNYFCEQYKHCIDSGNDELAENIANKY